MLQSWLTFDVRPPPLHLRIVQRGLKLLSSLPPVCVCVCHPGPLTDILPAPDGERQDLKGGSTGLCTPTPPPPPVLFKAWLCGNSFMQSAPVCLNVTGHDVPLSSTRTERKNWTHNPTGPDGRNLDLLKDVWANYNFFFFMFSDFPGETPLSLKKESITTSNANSNEHNSQPSLT